MWVISFRINKSYLRCTDRPRPRPNRYSRTGQIVHRVCVWRARVPHQTLCHLCVIMAARNRNEEMELLKLWTNASWPYGPKSLNYTWCCCYYCDDTSSYLLLIDRLTDRPTRNIAFVHFIVWYFHRSTSYPSYELIFHVFLRLHWIHWVVNRGTWRWWRVVEAKRTATSGRVCTTHKHDSFTSNCHAAGAIFSIRALPQHLIFSSSEIPNGIYTPLDVNFGTRERKWFGRMVVVVPFCSCHLRMRFYVGLCLWAADMMQDRKTIMPISQQYKRGRESSGG